MSLLETRRDQIFPGLLKGWGVIRARCEEWWEAKKIHWTDRLKEDLWDSSNS